MKFENEIINSLGTNQEKNILEKLSNIQQNLLKNHSNPVFSAKDKKILMKKYSQVENIGKSVYKYNTLKQHKMNAEAENQKEEVSDYVLKGGISNVKYIWHSENTETTCEKCKALDGTEYSFSDEVPERPHPNCKCTVEIKENPSENDEPCDCNEQLEEIIFSLEEGLSEAENLSGECETQMKKLEASIEHTNEILQYYTYNLEELEPEYGQHLPDCEFNINAVYDEIVQKKEYVENLLTFIFDTILHLDEIIKTIGFFVSQYGILLFEAYILKQHGMDKYRHSMANCKSAQIGEHGEKAAILLSYFKEAFDQYKNIYARTHNVSEEEAKADSERDHVANRLGREAGRKYPDCNCRDLLWGLRPKNKK